MSRERALEVTEEYLKNYKQIKTHIKILEEEKKMLAEMVATLPAIEYDSIRVQSSVAGSPTEQNAIALMEKALYIDSDLKNSRSAINKIDRAIDSLEHLQKKVVEMTLIENQNWNKVCYKLKYSERQLRRIREEAIYKIAVALFGATLFNENVRNMSDF